MFLLLAASAIGVLLQTDIPDLLDFFVLYLNDSSKLSNDRCRLPILMKMCFMLEFACSLQKLSYTVRDSVTCYWCVCSFYAFYLCVDLGT